MNFVLYRFSLFEELERKIEERLSLWTSKQKAIESAIQNNSGPEINQKGRGKKKDVKDGILDFVAMEQIKMYKMVSFEHEIMLGWCTRVQPVSWSFFGYYHYSWHHSNPCSEEHLAFKPQ